MGTPISPPSAQAPPGRRVDERPRTYRHPTPDHDDVVVDMAGAGDPVTVALERGSFGSARVLGLSCEEAWALWACLGDGLSRIAGQPPEWVAESIVPTDPDGNPLPELPARPF